MASRLSMPLGRIHSCTPLGNCTSMMGATDSVSVTGIHVKEGDAFGLVSDVSLIDGVAGVIAAGVS